MALPILVILYLFICAVVYIQFIDANKTINFCLIHFDFLYVMGILKKQKAKHRIDERYLAKNGGEQGIRTLEYSLKHYTISNRAPSASSDNSPCRSAIIHYVCEKCKTKITYLLKFFWVCNGHIFY